MTQADELRVARERLIAVLYEAGLGPTISEDLARMIEGLIDAKLGPVRVVGSLIDPNRDRPGRTYLDPLTGALGPDTPSTLGG